MCVYIYIYIYRTRPGKLTRACSPFYPPIPSGSMRQFCHFSYQRCRVLPWVSPSIALAER